MEEVLTEFTIITQYWTVMDSISWLFTKSVTGIVKDTGTFSV